MILNGVTIGVEFAQGGFGIVYKGTLGRQQVAIKTMRQYGGNMEHAIMVSGLRACVPFNLNFNICLYRRLLVKL